jgi:hypothetical protein
VETGRFFGRAIGHLVTAVNVQNILVSGKIHALNLALDDFQRPIFHTAMKEEMEKSSQEMLAKKTTIKIVDVNPDTSLIGAATQLLTHEYGIPRFFPERIEPTV